MNAIAPNSCGVYPEESAEVLNFIGKKAKAKIRVLKIETGWIQSCGVDFMEGNMCGFGAPLMADYVFETRAKAINGAVYWIVRQCKTVQTEHDSNVGQKVNAGLIIEWCRELLNGGVLKQEQLL